MLSAGKYSRLLKNTACSELTLRCLRDCVRPLQRGHGLFPDRDRPPGTLDSCGDRGDDVPTVPGPPCTPDGRGKITADG